MVLNFSKRDSIPTFWLVYIAHFYASWNLRLFESLSDNKEIGGLWLWKWISRFDGIVFRKQMKQGKTKWNYKRLETYETWTCGQGSSFGPLLWNMFPVLYQSKQGRLTAVSFCTMSFSSTGFYHSDMLSDDSVTAQISCSLQGWI